MAAILKTSKSKGLTEIILSLPPLNLYTKELADALSTQLERVAFDEPPYSLYIMYGSEYTHFSAGGDLKYMHELQKKGPAAWNSYFFKVFHYATHLKRIQSRSISMSLGNGIACGGGLSKQLFADFRVFTENSKVSMPEAAGGFFTDAGACYNMPRMINPSLALYACVTGMWFKGEEIAKMGYSTHFVKGADIKKIRDEVVEIAKVGIQKEEVESVLKKYVVPVDTELPELNEIEEIFQFDSLQDIFKRIEKSQTPFVKQLKKYLESTKPSPLSMAISFNNMKKGLNQTREEAMILEYKTQLGMAFCEDFVEGVRARMLDKDHNPQWKYKTVFDVPESAVAFFEEIKPEQSEEELLKIIRA